MFCINAYFAHTQIKHYALDIRLYSSQIVGSEIRHCLPRLAFQKKQKSVEIMLKKYTFLMHLIIRIALRICHQIGSIVLENKV